METLARELWAVWWVRGEREAGQGPAGEAGHRKAGGGWWAVGFREWCVFIGWEGRGSGADGDPSTE